MNQSSVLNVRSPGPVRSRSDGPPHSARERPAAIRRRNDPRETPISRSVPDCVRGRPKEAHHHQMQIHRQRIHGDHFAVMSADELRSGRRPVRDSGSTARRGVMPEHSQALPVLQLLSTYCAAIWVEPNDVRRDTPTAAPRRRKDDEIAPRTTPTDRPRLGPARLLGRASLPGPA